jgi:hypothetical protein
MIRWRINWRDERGVSAVIVAVSMVAIFGAAMLSVDAGNLWQTRRNAVTATDAAALRAAADVALDPALIGGTDCGPNWSALLNRNVPVVGTQPSMTCQAFHPVNATTGYVTVSGTLLSQAKFSRVLGIGDQRPFSSSSAMFGYTPDVVGLRPLGICNNNHHVQEWLQLKAGTLSQAAYNLLPVTEYLDASYVPPRIGHPGILEGYTPQVGKVIHRIWFDKSPAEVNNCGGTTPGNWGFQDYDGGNNATSDLVDWFLNGYQGVVSVGDCDPATNGGQPCDGNPGFGGGGGVSCPKNSNSLQDALNCLLGHKFAILIYDAADCPTNGQGGGGSNCTFGAWQFLFVILRGFNLGSTGNTTETYFDFEFTNSIVQGPCCELNPQNADTGVLGLKLCSVDHDTTDASVHCTPT